MNNNSLHLSIDFYRNINLYMAFNMHMHPIMYIKTNSNPCINSNNLHTRTNQYMEFNLYTKFRMHINLNSNSLYTGIHQYIEFNFYAKFNINMRIHIEHSMYIYPTIYMRTYMHLNITIKINTGSMTTSLCIIVLFPKFEIVISLFLSA